MCELELQNWYDTVNDSIWDLSKRHNADSRELYKKLRNVKKKEINELEEEIKEVYRKNALALKRIHQDYINYEKDKKDESEVSESLKAQNEFLLDSMTELEEVIFDDFLLQLAKIRTKGKKWGNEEEKEYVVLVRETILNPVKVIAKDSDQALDLVSDTYYTNSMWGKILTREPKSHFTTFSVIK